MQAARQRRPQRLLRPLLHPLDGDEIQHELSQGVIIVLSGHVRLLDHPAVGKEHVSGLPLLFPGEPGVDDLLSHPEEAGRPFAARALEDLQAGDQDFVE